MGKHFGLGSADSGNFSRIEIRIAFKSKKKNVKKNWKIGLGKIHFKYSLRSVAVQMLKVKPTAVIFYLHLFCDCYCCS